MRIEIRVLLPAIGAAALLLGPTAAHAAQAAGAGCVPPSQRRNVVLFVADGMRRDSVQPELTPTMFSLRRNGVEFIDSHSLYPTSTTPNASVLATGHAIGDTGVFGNALYVGRPIRGKDPLVATLTPFVENNLQLASLNALWGGRFMEQKTLVELATENGYSVAVVGKAGPAAMQDIGEIRHSAGVLQPTEAVLLEDNHSIALPDAFSKAIADAGLAPEPPDRSNGRPGTLQDNGNGGSDAAGKTRRGTIAANHFQQQYLANAVTQAILPTFLKSPKPFFLVYWSRDPDASQHNQGDNDGAEGLGLLRPGIDGPTSRAAVHNADSNLWQIVDFLRNADGNLLDHTDVVVVSDHGFSTVSRRELSRSGERTNSYASTLDAVDGATAPGRRGTLPPGFLAIDLAHALQKPLYDPDAPFVQSGSGQPSYKPIVNAATSTSVASPLWGNGVIGGTGKVPEDGSITDAEIVVAANGGSDLVYLPQADRKANEKLAAQIADFLLRQDYVDGVFSNDDFGAVAGTLRLSDVGLLGRSKLPRPAFVVNFKSFQIGADPLVRAEIADTTFRPGQGMHGGFSRADTFNTMFAFGPDFKSGYVDRVPADNADVAATLACLMGLELPLAGGSLGGRVLSEALKGGPDPTPPGTQVQLSAEPGPNGARTVLVHRDFAGRRYYDEACLSKQVRLDDPCE